MFILPVPKEGEAYGGTEEGNKPPTQHYRPPRPVVCACKKESHDLNSKEELSSSSATVTDTQVKPTVPQFKNCEVPSINAIQLQSLSLTQGSFTLTNNNVTGSTSIQTWQNENGGKAEWKSFWNFRSGPGKWLEEVAGIHQNFLKILIPMDKFIDFTYWQAVGVSGFFLMSLYLLLYLVWSMCIYKMWRISTQKKVDIIKSTLYHKIT